MLLGLSLICIGACVFLMVLGVRRAFVEVPAEDREFLDAPPPAFRIAWPLVQLVSFRLGGFLSVSYRHRVQLALRHAGLDYALSPEQFFAGKIVCGLVAAGVLTLLLAANETSSPLWAGILGACGFLFP